MSQDLPGPPRRPPLSIFVSSPGDVAEERLIAKRILDRLAAEFAPVASIEPFFWEHEPLLASDTFQAEILRLLRPSNAHIVICMLWSRLGTRLPEQFTRPDGTPYNSGTEFELEDALEGWRRCGVPDLLVYHKTAEPLVSLRDTHAASQALQQKMLLDAFIQRFFHGRDGTLLASLHSFDNTADFETRLETHVRKLIEGRLETLEIRVAGGVVRPTWNEGCPFRGLQVFEFEHHAIFFGRTRAIGETLDRLKRQAAAGRAFLLVLGASGCGKSSLVRAGVLPLLVEPGVAEGVGLWRRAVVRPSERAGDLFDGLGAALLRPEALPELGSDGTTAEKLSQLLRANPDATQHLVKGALSQAASHLHKAKGSAVQPDARFVLVLDQLEELFTAGDLTPEHRNAFFRAVCSLAESGHTWVLATLRSDFYHRCAEIPGLVALKAGSGQYDLVPPDPSEIAQLVRRPAIAAGLRFEEDLQTGDRLDDRLRDAAVANRDSLPLLEFTLDELYRRRSGTVLTLAAYKEVGGMEGALARRADEVFAALPEPARNSLPRVFRELVAVDEGEADHPTRKQASLDAFGTAGETSPRRQLVEAFIAARLLTATVRAERVPRTHSAPRDAVGPRAEREEHRPGAAVVEVAHEALCNRWQPLVDWLAHDRELLRVRGRIAAAAARWDEEGRRSDLLLQTGKPLDEATQLVAAGFDLRALENDFIAASRTQARRRRATRRLTIAALIVLPVIAAIVATTGYVISSQARQRAVTAEEQATAQKQEAEAQTHKAEENAALAIAARKEAEAQKQQAEQNARQAIAAEEKAMAQKQEAERNARRANSLQKASESRAMLPRAPRLSLEAARDALTLTLASREAAPPEAERAFRDALEKNHERLHVDLLTARHGPGEIPSSRVAVGGGGRWLAASCMDNTVRCWDLNADDPAATCRVLPLAANIIRFWITADDRWLVTATAHDARLWNLQAEDSIAASGNLVSLHESCTEEIRITLSPNGKWLIVATCAFTRLCNLTLEKPWAEPIVLDPSLMEVAISADNHWLVAWNALTIFLLDLKDPTKPPNRVSHRNQPVSLPSIALSADSGHLFAADRNGVANVWNLRGATPVKETPEWNSDNDWEGVVSVDYSPHSRYLLAKTNTEIRLWDASGWKLLKQDTIRRRPSPTIASPRLGPGQGETSSDAQSPARDETKEQAANANRDSGAGTESYNRWSKPIETSWSPDERWLIAVADGAVHVYDLSETPVTGRSLPGQAGETLVAAISPDGRWLATGGADKRTRVWPLVRGGPLRQPSILDGHEGMVTSVAFRAQRSQSATGAASTAWNVGNLITWDTWTARLWDVAEEDPTVRRLLRCALDGTVATMNSPGKTPDAKPRWLLTAEGRDFANLWDVSAHDRDCLPRVLRGHADQILAVAITPDGDWAVTASKDRTVRLWNLGPSPRTAACTVLKHEGEVVACAVSNDGHWLVTGSTDKQVRVWKLSPEAIPLGPTELHGHSETVNRLAISPDSRWLLTGSLDHAVLLWDLHKLPNAGRSLRPYPWYDPVAHGKAAVDTEGIRLLDGDDRLSMLWSEHLQHFRDDYPPRVAIPDIETKLQSLGAEKLILGAAPRWSPDGTRLLFQRGLDEIGVHDLASHESDVPVARGNDAVWSPVANDLIAFVHGERQHEKIYLMRLAERNQPRAIADGDSPSWTGDGGRLFFRGRDSNRVMVLSNPDQPGRSTQRRGCDLNVWAPVVSPDGTMVAGAGNQWLWVVDLSSRKILKERRTDWKGGLVGWSPDSQIVAFGDASGNADTGLWLLPLNRGDSYCVLPGPCTSPAWSSDGSIAFELRTDAGSTIWRISCATINELYKAEERQAKRRPPRER